MFTPDWIAGFGWGAMVATVGLMLVGLKMAGKNTTRGI